MTTLSLGLALHNSTSEMSHPYPELWYNTRRTYAFSTSESKIVLQVRNQSEFVPGPFQCLPLKFFFEKRWFLFHSLMTPFSGFTSIGLLPPCPFSYFLKQGHAFPVRPKQRRGTCEPLWLPVLGQILRGYSGTARAAQQKSIKHSGESPSVTFIILAKN